MAQRKKKSGKWIQAANKEMERKGTKGAFGKATEKKIARAKRKGGKATKRAIFAQNMKRIAKRRKRRGRKRS
jgi:hypothetical protein